MNVEWQRAPSRRPAYWADVNGRRLYVEQTVRSDRAHGIVGEEFQVFVSGVRVGECASLADAQTRAQSRSLIG